MKIGFPGCREKEEPIFLDLRSSVGRVAGKLCEGRVGL